MRLEFSLARNPMSARGLWELGRQLSPTAAACQELLQTVVLETIRVSIVFDYAGPFTETVLLGNVAAHFPGETLELDAARLRFPKKPQADALLTRTIASRGA
jgi:hypothetical protein